MSQESHPRSRKLSPLMVKGSVQQLTPEAERTTSGQPPWLVELSKIQPREVLHLQETSLTDRWPIIPAFFECARIAECAGWPPRGRPAYNRVLVGIVVRRLPWRPSLWRSLGIMKTTRMEQDVFGVTADGITVDRYTLRNSRGMAVSLITYGATVTELWAPGLAGQARRHRPGVRQPRPVRDAKPLLRLHGRPGGLSHRGRQVFARRQDVSVGGSTAGSTICTAASRGSAKSCGRRSRKNVLTPSR